jgi:hypothetical protein
MSADEVQELERIARERLASGDVGDSVQLALDQLVADRTNGEPLDTAYRRLRDTLRADGRERRASP